MTPSPPAIIYADQHARARGHAHTQRHASQSFSVNGPPSTEIKILGSISEKKGHHWPLCVPLALELPPLPAPPPPFQSLSLSPSWVLQCAPDPIAWPVGARTHPPYFLTSTTTRENQLILYLSPSRPRRARGKPFPVGQGER